MDARQNTPLGALRSNDPNSTITFASGEGVYLWDVEGRRYLDFLSGYSSTIFGHCHPRLVRAATEQLGTLTQLVGLQHPWRQALEARLAELAPMPMPVKTWLATSGARAVEIAWKVAYAFRPGKIVAFDLAYHGRSIATAQISDTCRLPILQDAAGQRLRYPQCSDCPVGLNSKTCNAECFDDSEKWIDENASELSAIIVEPAIGARGYFYAPPSFFKRLQTATRRHGILLIDDEIQMGLGRLGAIFASRIQGWEPDIAILGKSLGGGIAPITAVVGRSEIMNSLPEGYESETFAANPFACRLALESLDLLIRDRLIDRSSMICDWLAGELRLLQTHSKYPIRVDCQGASGIIDVFSSSANLHLNESNDGGSSGKIARNWSTAARDAGLLVQLSGLNRTRIVLIPPLIIEQPQIQQAFKILRATQ